MSGNSVTLWIQSLDNDDETAAQALFERYFDRLVALARKKLSNIPRRVVDEEDVAITAFYSCIASARKGRYPSLKNRDELWRLLVTITERKVLDAIRKHRSAKRGGGNVRGESVFMSPNGNGFDLGISEIPDREPTEKFADFLAEEYTRLMDLLKDDDLAQIAHLVLEGYSTSEIATRIDRTQRTVQRRIKLIQTIWSDDHQAQAGVLS